jgi:hypothetical protein
MAKPLGVDSDLGKASGLAHAPATVLKLLERLHRWRRGGTAGAGVDDAEAGRPA